MAIEAGDLAGVHEAIQAVEHVRGISALHTLERPDGALVVVARVGLSPVLRLPEIVYLISEIDAVARQADPRIQAVFVEPDIAADSTTPTEAIVIRSLD